MYHQNNLPPFVPFVMYDNQQSEAPSRIIKNVRHVTTKINLFQPFWRTKHTTSKTYMSREQPRFYNLLKSIHCIYYSEVVSLYIRSFFTLFLLIRYMTYTSSEYLRKSVYRDIYGMRKTLIVRIVRIIGQNRVLKVNESYAGTIEPALPPKLLGGYPSSNPSN